MFIRRLAMALVTGVILGGCGGTQHLGVTPDSQARELSSCLVFDSAKRASQSRRAAAPVGLVDTTTCNGTINGDPSGDTDFDVESFQDIVDSTMGADPCMANVRRCFDAQLSLSDTIYADPGGPAKRGDNCTPVNGYAIGYSLGGGTGKAVVAPPGAPINLNNSMTIVNQSVMYAIDPTGNQTPIGWVLYTSGGQAFFVPDLVAAFGVAVTSFSTVAPSAYPISINARNSQYGTNAVRGIFAQIGNASNTAMLNTFLGALKNAGSVANVPCNSSSLQTA